MSGQNTAYQGKTHGVVVGVDGSKRSLAAATWALREAERTHRPLTLISVYSLPMFPSMVMDSAGGSEHDNALADSARKILEATAEKLGPTDVEIRAATELGDPATVLVDYSEHADLLVAGPRGRGGFLGLLVGSVSRGLPARAKCPVALVPKGAEESRAGTDAPVVVGADGSRQARLAMLRAGEEAMNRGTWVRLVTAMAPVSPAVEWLPAPVDENALLEELREKMEYGRNWLQHHFPQLRIEAEVIDGVPVDVMVKESESARLVVVGTRGLGGFTGALLGSTSQGIVSHAKGPVLVVPADDDPRLEDRTDFGPTLDEHKDKRPDHS
ncbi:universal stress protein [Auritidibacter ignavus]|uniref:universal stress protein n=1 Tax=Auritidibacter ignavus TaxID=678932 RepID=UPI00109C0FAD|nr:universal stress protein [Auritidibacter ignavus]